MTTSERAIATYKASVEAQKYNRLKHANEIAPFAIGYFKEKEIDLVQDGEFFLVDGIPFYVRLMSPVSGIYSLTPKDHPSWEIVGLDGLGKYLVWRDEQNTVIIKTLGRPDERVKIK